MTKFLLLRLQIITIEGSKREELCEKGQFADSETTAARIGTKSTQSGKSLPAAAAIAVYGFSCNIKRAFLKKRKQREGAARIRIKPIYI
jgi:hypothetical protein